MARNRYVQTEARSRETSPARSTQSQLVDALRRALERGGPGGTQLIETHISYVLLAGEFAFKIKKAVALRFLDFRSLAARRFYCEEELRLNRRLAPEIYLDVVPIAGSVEAPVLGGAGPAIEYAVKMRAFPQDALAIEMLRRGKLKDDHIDALAATIAAFHSSVNVGRPDSAFGTPHAILRVALEVFSTLRPLLDDAPDLEALDRLQAWTRTQHSSLAAVMAKRHATGHVRECHGDLHLGNIAIVDDKLIVFDGIEFSEGLRWIDVMSEVAFTVMDLEDRGHAGLAFRFCDAYLEITGDYPGLAVLRFYRVHRALVRAMVARLRAEQSGTRAAAEALRAEYRAYVDLAGRFAEPPRPALVITHGPSGCGKSSFSQGLLESIGAVRIRSDVERKRLHGLKPTDREAAGMGSVLYAPDVTRETYSRMLELARHALRAGCPVIVDATFLLRWQRQMFRTLSAQCKVPFAILDFVARQATLRRRVLQRAARQDDASDANLAVLQHQLRTQQPLAEDELAETVHFDAEISLDEARAPKCWDALRARIGR